MRHTDGYDAGLSPSDPFVKEIQFGSIVRAIAVQLGRNSRWIRIPKGDFESARDRFVRDPGEKREGDERRATRELTPASEPLRENPWSPPIPPEWALRTVQTIDRS